MLEYTEQCEQDFDEPRERMSGKRTMREKREREREILNDADKRL